MALPQGINFRSTLLYVTDGANDSFENCLNAIGAPSYPRTTAQGNTVGWEDAQGNIRDRNSGNDPRLAGCMFTTATSQRFRIDLPSSGSYNVRMAGGDAGGAQAPAWQLLDTTTVLTTVGTGSTTGNDFYDATNVLRTAAAWPGSNAAYAATFATTICRIRSNTSSASPVAHFYVESGAAPTPTGTYASTLGSTVMSASGQATDVGAFASTLANATMTASGSVGSLPSGAFASSLASAVMAANGTITDIGAFSATLAGCTMTASGVAQVNPTGTLSSTLDNASMSASGYVGTPPVLTGITLRRRQRPRVFQTPYF